MILGVEICKVKGDIFMSITMTRWRIENINTLEEFADNLELIPRALEDIVWQDGSPIYTVVGNINECDYNYIHSIEIQDTEYRYLSFTVTVERAKKENKWYNTDGTLKDRRDRINTYQSNMIAFVDNGSIEMIAFTAKSTVTRIIRHAFDNEVWQEISEIPCSINEDMFYWLLKRLRDYPATNLHNTVDVNISGLWSYLGTTCDGNNAFRAKGRRVLAVLGTLAVIFSSEELKALRPEFQHDGNVIVIELNLNNTIKIYDDYYIGNFNAYNGQEKSNVLALYTINELIPNILNAYNANVTDDIWSIQLKLDFLRTIGQEIMDRVEEELQLLENETEEHDDDIINGEERELPLDYNEELIEDDELE